MSNNKQSSVEWLIEQMFEQGYFDVNKPLTFTNLDHLQEQAKTMHKEEMIQAAADHCYPTCELAKIDAEQYYNETFGGNNEQQ